MRKHSWEDAVFVRTAEQHKEPRQKAYLSGLEVDSEMAEEQLPSLNNPPV